VDDKLILYGFIAGFVLNAILAAQMVFYWNAAPAKKDVKGKGREKVPVERTGSTTATANKAKSPTTRRRG
jgi:mannose-P-dolichol utilization defect 1